MRSTNAVTYSSLVFIHQRLSVIPFCSRQEQLQGHPEAWSKHGLFQFDGTTKMMCPCFSSSNSMEMIEIHIFDLKGVFLTLFFL